MVQCSIPSNYLLILRNIICSRCSSQLDRGLVNFLKPCIEVEYMTGNQIAVHTWRDMESFLLDYSGRRADSRRTWLVQKKKVIKE